VVSDSATPESYSQKDTVGDNGWPQLTPNRKSNFDIVNAEVIIVGGIPEEPVEQEIDEEPSSVEEEVDEGPSSVEEETPAEEEISTQEDTQYEEEGTEEYTGEEEESTEKNEVTKEEIVDDVINIFKKLIKKQL
jgi:hypothetical protein